MNKLADKVHIKGLGIKDLYADLIKRKGRVAIYLRTDGYYEIGIIQRLSAGEVFGKQYPDRERYWYTEEFGSVAKTTKRLKRAEEHYDDFLKHEQSKGQ